MCSISAIDTAQKMKFSIKDFFSKHLLKKSLMENVIICAMRVDASLNQDN